MKKFISLLLSLLLCASAPVTAQAAGRDVPPDPDPVPAVTVTPENTAGPYSVPPDFDQGAIE